MSASIVLWESTEGSSKWCNILTPFVTLYNQQSPAPSRQKKKLFLISTVPGAPLTIGTFANRYRSPQSMVPLGLPSVFTLVPVTFFSTVNCTVPSHNGSLTGNTRIEWPMRRRRKDGHHHFPNPYKRQPLDEATRCLKSWQYEFVDGHHQASSQHVTVLKVGVQRIDGSKYGVRRAVVTVAFLHIHGYPSNAASVGIKEQGFCPLDQGE
ncbi:hypothetical protein BKA83DRAFT_4124492 [Pisolithus microcarpus]|nr:hypothetical protein BKA83DRAFT_4124492 [Pisolithus microcarpus]